MRGPDSVREHLSRMNWAPVDQTNGDDPDVQTSFAPLIVAQRKCSCLRSA